MSSPPLPSDPRALPALYRFAALATHSDDALASMREMLATLVATFHADAGAIGLVNPDNGELEMQVLSGSFPEAGPDTSSSLKIGHGVTGWCVLHRRSLLVPDVTAEPRYIAVRPAARCEMAAPLQEGDNIIGVIDLESDRPGGFTPADLALLELLATEAALVLQRLWQVGHLKNKARQLESLITAGQSLVTKLEAQALFDTLTKEARHVMEARACSLYLYDSAAASVRCVSSDGGGPASTGELPVDSCLVASPIHTRRAIWFPDIASPEYSELLDLPAARGLRSALATPLVIEREVLGVVVIFTDRVHRFDNDELRLSTALASLGAVALQNARLYARVFQSEDVLRKNERLTTLGLLAAEIAHEIRNPLTVLKLLHGGLGLDFPPGDPRWTDMRVIGEKLDQLEAIVTRVLGFAQAPTSLHSRWSFAEIVADTLLLVRLKLAQSQVAVEFTPPPHPVFVEAHKGQLQQVLLNLLLNATHAMPAGGTVAITLATGNHAGAPCAILDLSDTGPGVDPAIRERIFDSFLSGRPGGTGLGLAIAKRILISHHGDIILHATSPAGTTMRLTLPLAP
ncbi:MAG: GAF domain-containing protein [Opitutaceae bacterium]|nr:GAF domain-containing protein [Opitutaceae bacterium]